MEQKPAKLAILPLFALAVFISGAFSGQAAPEKRESIFDRQVHLENTVTDIPPVPRLCDSLDLIKRKINVGDCELYVEEEGRGTPLVLINGGPGGTHHYFHPWFSRAKDFARIIYYDQRGCGLSDHQPGPNGYSVDQAAADLDALRRALGIDKWVVLGYSYGGFLAQYYAVKYPRDLAGLILLGASPGMWTEMKPTRQYDFLSPEERKRFSEIRKELAALAEAQKWPAEKMMALLVYNNHRNGDWKRQHFYRPSPEKLAQGALYEWNFDMKNNFRGGIGGSEAKIDLTGAFRNCPVPTLLLEGKWDLTWNTDKPVILAGNHPGSKLVLFENAGHGVYDEEPDRFFAELRDFLTKLPPISPAAVSDYESYLRTWDAERKASPLFVIQSAGYGKASITALAKSYQREWCGTINDCSLLLKLGFAQYETANYAEGLFVFEKMQQAAEKKGNPGLRALALIWQGHMLDLLGKRAEAVVRYGKAAEANVADAWTHSQYGLTIELTPYAKERMAHPFVRVENMDKN